jgi:signal transduction histidine kinase
MIAGTLFLGELITRRSKTAKSTLSSHEYLGFSYIVFAVTTLLHQAVLQKKLQEKSEELGTALWKNKQINLQLMQTERLAAVGQLAAGAAHEINNPLAIIYARAQFLLSKEVDQKKRKELEQITEQIERISSILTNLMGFARPAPPKLEELSLNDILEKALTLVETECRKRHITILRDYGRNLPKMKGDPKQLEQLFLNLLINAQHAMEKEGGTLVVFTKITEDHKNIIVGIRDTGMGIPKENMAQIFDPFFTTKEDGKGTGLGLSTSYGIINNHYGTIKVESETGVGTTMLVEVPVNLEALRHSEDSGWMVKQLPSVGGPAEVLVVEDEKHIREILKEALEAEGLKVDTAENGQEGLERIQKGDYRLVILDIRMPARNGLSLLSEIKHRTKEVSVIVITGMATPEQMEEALVLGAAKCIQKPFQIKSLIKDIFDLLNKRTV